MNARRIPYILLGLIVLGLIYGAVSYKKADSDTATAASSTTTTTLQNPSAAASASPAPALPASSTTETFATFPPSLSA